MSPNTVQPHYGPLLDFVGERVETRGYVDLMTTFGQGRLSRKMLNELGAIVSTPHLKMKFSTLMGEILTIKVDQK